MFRLEQIPIERSNYVLLESKIIKAYKAAGFYLIGASLIFIIAALSSAKDKVYTVISIEILWILINVIIFARNLLR